MAYRKPSDTEIMDAIKEALRRHGIVNSQRKMTDLVLKELHRHDPDYAVSEVRVRKIAIKNKLARVSIRYRGTKEKTAAGKCPVCNGRMNKLRNLTVYGGTVTRGYKCTVCGYWTGLKHQMAGQYVFEPE